MLVVQLTCITVQYNFMHTGVGGEGLAYQTSRGIENIHRLPISTV